MHCPKCSQLAPDEVSFCSRCGMALEGVRALVTNADGAEDVRALRAQEPRSPALSPRQRGVRLGAKLLALFVLLLPLYPLLGAISAELFPSVENTTRDELPMQLVTTLYALLLLTALARIAYARMFESPVGPDEEERDAPASLGGARGRAALPPPRAIPVADFVGARRVNTAEVVRPASVAEHTTRSLRAE